MGEDLVYACTSEKMLLNWNLGDRRHSKTMTDITAEATIAEATIAEEDGITTCTVQLEANLLFTVPESDLRRHFNLT